MLQNTFVAIVNLFLVCFSTHQWRVHSISENSSLIIGATFYQMAECFRFSCELNLGARDLHNHRHSGGHLGQDINNKHWNWYGMAISLCKIYAYVFDIDISVNLISQVHYLQLFHSYVRSNTFCLLRIMCTTFFFHAFARWQT